MEKKMEEKMEEKQSLSSILQKLGDNDSTTLILPLKCQLGAHTGFSSKDKTSAITDVIRTSVNYAMHATQFFLGAKYKHTRYSPSSEDVSRANRLLERFPMHVFTHFCLACNLVGSKDCLAWNGNEVQDGKTRFLVSELEKELKVVSRLSCCGKRSGVVVHPGNYSDRKRGLNAISTSVNKINFEEGCNLLLENAAGQGDSLATTLEEIKQIVDGIEEGKRGYVNVCIDTCHLFAVGDYDISEVKEVERFFTDFDEVIGLEKLHLIHLNDSVTQRGSHVDRHACIGTGYIWGKSLDSLVYLIGRCNELNIPLILETHGTDMITVSSLDLD